MGWVRFVLFAVAITGLIAGIWFVLDWRNGRDASADIPILTTQSANSCETLQSNAVAFTLQAERRLEAAPAEAYAAASDAFVASELAAVVCPPQDWADPKLRTRPPELQQAAYRRLATGSIRDLTAACAAMEASFIGEAGIEALLRATGQTGYAVRLKDRSASFVCPDRARYHINPGRPSRGGLEPDGLPLWPERSLS
ncbi:hypothetical protein [Hyphobacterium sp.]|uniref:hypothetical protein n=1 Tax=Hyphobacterium sp. TaxID=2004662 RepID=UPI003B5261D1